jgi:hypothetical protein
MTIHTFYDSGDAYDATQCREDIKTGDTLLIPGDDSRTKTIIGLAWTWPLAITAETGHLHSALPGEFHNVLLDAGISDDQLATAVAVAREHGAPLIPDLTPPATPTTTE